MAADPRIDRPYRVRFDEADESGHLRSSGFLRYAQDLAWLHSEGAGFGRSWYRERGLAWLIRSVELEVLQDVPYGEELSVSTEVLGFRRVWARRRSEFSASDSERPLAMALIDWVLLNARGVPVRVPAEILDTFSSMPGIFTPLRVELGRTPDRATERDFAPRQSEVDPLGHVNNASYLDYVDEHLARTGRRSELRRRPRRYRVEFVSPAEAGASLTGLGWDDGLAWCYRLEAAGGREVLRARFETDPATWVGG